MSKYLNKLNSRIIQSVMDVFPQVPPTIRKNVDDLTNSSLLLFKNSFELQMRSKIFLCIYKLNRDKG